jgi:hypothetical protein
VSLRLAGALAVALLSAGCGTADATATPPNPDFTCSFTHPSKSWNALRKLPSPLRAYIRDKVGPMADRGKFFNAGDVVQKPAPFNRFIRGGEIGERWFLWYEHGGFAYWRQILIFGSDPSGTPHVVAEKHGDMQSTLCAQTDALLDSSASKGP